MQDLSLHILDIAQNSVRAKASRIRIEVLEKPSQNLLTLKIEDNGCGMTSTLKENVTNPFVTTRTLRKVGLGLPLLKQNCEGCGGSLIIESLEGKGTSIYATMCYDHIDRIPIGDLASTMITLIQGSPQVEWYYIQQYEEKSFEMNTNEIKEILNGVPIDDLEILEWLREFLRGKIEALYEKKR